MDQDSQPDHVAAPSLLSAYDYRLDHWGSCGSDKRAMSLAEFPRRYALASLGGPSVREYFQNRADAFQQLVADGARAMGGRFARTYPTTGPDGAIDVFLEPGATLRGPFEGLTLPIVVEAKDNDDSKPRVVENVWAAWKDVKERVQAHADKGWDGLYTPWKHARSYVFITSAIFPSQHHREQLETDCRDFFSGLGSEHCKIKEVRLFDWNDIRGWLNSFDDVRDYWLGTGSSYLLTVDEYKKSLIGFKRFLSPDVLAFKEPSSESPHHPNNILSAFTKEGAFGAILLVGTGGIGKTRICFEVAQDASHRGWRVLHILPGPSNLVMAALHEAVLAGAQDQVLIVFDYLEHFPDENLDLIRRSLIPKARERNIAVRLLANCRPGYAWKASEAREELFTRLEVRLSTSESEALSQWLIEKAAPTASKRLSRDEMVNLCSRRPIIALLSAQQLEDDSQSETARQPIEGSNPLVHWLRKRLREDDLTPQDGSIWSQGKISPALAASAAVIACTPDNYAALAEAATGVIPIPEAIAGSGNRVLDVLLQLGWLESDRDWISPVHDVVTDELVQQVVFDGDYLRPEILDRLLASGLRRIRSFGRLANTFTRIRNGTTVARARAIDSSLHEWMERNASLIGNLATADEPTHGSYAFGAALTGSVFEEAMLERWSEAVAPWLEKHGTDIEARHLLFKGLSRARPANAEGLVKAACIWLEKWRHDKTASFVLGPLLRLQIAETAAGKKIATIATEWLETFSLEDCAKFVLRSLFSGPFTNQIGRTRVIAAAIGWIKESWKNEELGTDSSVILSELLRLYRLRPEEIGEVARMMERLILDLGGSVSARWALGALLAVDNDEVYPIGQRVDWALQWMERFGLERWALSVLAPLIDFTNPTRRGRAERHIVEFNVRRKIINAANQWLARYDEQEAASYVIAELAKGIDLRESDAKLMQASALRWLKRFGKDERAGFILDPLLKRSELTPSEAQVVSAFALEWLQGFGRKPVADFVLRRLLHRRELLAQQVNDAANIADQWVSIYGEDENARFILQAMMQRSDSPREVLLRVTGHAIKWCAIWNSSPVPGFVLAPMLNLSGNDMPAESIYKVAKDWLLAHADEEDAGFVFVPWFASSLFGYKEKLAVEKSARRWASRFQTTAAGAPALAVLLSLPPETVSERPRQFAETVSWLTRNSHHPCAADVCSAAVRNPHLDARTASSIAVFLLRGAIDPTGLRMLKKIQPRISRQSSIYQQVVRVLS